MCVCVFVCVCVCVFVCACVFVCVYVYVCPCVYASVYPCVYRILKLQESGVLEVWQQRWWRTSTDCGTPRQPGSTSVSDQRQQLEVVSIGGVLILYSAVLLLATLCFLLHQLWLSGTLRCLRARMADSWAASACHCR